MLNVSNISTPLSYTAALTGVVAGAYHLRKLWKHSEQIDRNLQKARSRLSQIPTLLNEATQRAKEEEQKRGEPGPGMRWSAATPGRLDVNGYTREDSKLRSLIPKLETQQKDISTKRDRATRVFFLGMAVLFAGAVLHQIISSVE